MDPYNTSNMSTIQPSSEVITTTVSPCNDTTAVYMGYIAAGIAVLFYGSNFAPVKKFETGDGMFFQWILCSAIWITGLVVHLIRGSPKFYPIVMVGGVIWETGNVCVVPIIKTIGLSIGLSIWAATNLLSGWATGRFGLFGVNPELPDNFMMNYFGVALAVSSAFIFSFVKNETSSNITESSIVVSSSDRSPLIPDNSLSDSTSTSIYTSDPSHETIVFSRRMGRTNINGDLTTRGSGSFFDNLSTSRKRVLGISLSLASGLLYGQQFTPAIYVQDRYSGASQDGLDYVFSTFSGIFLSSTFYFLVYCIFMKNKPNVYPEAILPGAVSGLMWGIATSSYFVANKVLSEPVSFPIISTGPAIIAALIGLFVFKEIRGKRNLLILLLGFSVTITGALLAGLSKNSRKSC
ncbi:hypothetical protein CHS0354_012948 [Potamilus streckersoni]|uniref:Transmembrane protein 144 n=1 Tax=Potamilus streckersoni TaxID=2493646 RepID=A0AAE0RP23_9BIVA|nr:hypothetical protein CHS0354_012948 [Potamilus streckersoni]